MSQTSMNVRIDADIKKRFDAFCASVGMNASVAVNMFARAVLREQRIPFEIAGSDEILRTSAKNKRSSANIEPQEASKEPHEMFEINPISHYPV